MKLLNKLILLFLLLLLPFAAIATTSQHIAYSDVGTGKPLVLIHAWPADQRLWKPQQEGLKNHFRVISVDLWGFGQSASPPSKIYTMEMYADEIKQLLDQLHIQQAIIGGESMGGYVSLAFLKKYPERVSGLILADTQAIADTPEQVENRKKQAASILADGPATHIRNFMPKALSPYATEETRIYLQGLFEAQTAEAMSASLLGIAYREDNTFLLSKTNVPVLIISGELDTLISPEQSKNMHALAKNSRLVLLSKAGHIANLEKPLEWNQAVIDRFAAASMN
jgi:pimeloyl-ACP methyl ester carboxylesterase